MLSAKENTVRSSKKIPCYCPRCNGKSVNPRTKRDHINLADIGSTSISEGQSSSKRKHNEEPLPELPKHGNSDSEDSKNEDTEIEDSNNEDSNSNNSESNRMESNGSESDEESTTNEEDSTTNEEDSTTNEEDSTTSNENSIESSTNSINTFHEDDFEEQSPIIERSAKDKFKQPSPVDDEEINIEQSSEVSSPYNVYQPSDDDEVMMILDEEPDDPSSPSDSLNDSNDTASESSKDSQESHGPINFIPPEIDPEIFDPPFTFDDNNKNEWILLWIMKY